MSRQLFRPSDLRGVLQLAGRYVLIVACLAGMGCYVVGRLTAPVVRAHEALPGWFQPYFGVMAGLIAALAIVLLVQLDTWSLGLSLGTVIAVDLFMVVGLAAAIAGATTLPSRGWYSQLLGLADLGAAAAVATAVVVGIKRHVVGERKTRRSWGERLRGRKQPGGPPA